MGFRYREPGGESQAMRLLLVMLSVLFGLCTSGIVFGYSGLYKVLVHKAKAFADLCPDSEPVGCTVQRDRLTLMYTIGAATVSGGAFFIGLFLDYFGPRLTVMVGSGVLWAGLLALANAAEYGNWCYYVGFFCLGISGPTIFNAMMNFGELFPRASAAVIGAQNGAFDASTVVMFMLGLLVDQDMLTFKGAMLMYTVVPGVIFFCALFLFPDRPYGAESGSTHQGELARTHQLRVREQSQRGAAPATDEETGVEAPLLEKPAESPPDIYNTDFSTQISTFMFWFMAIITGMLVLRVNFYIGTVYPQLFYTAEHQQKLAPGAPPSLSPSPSPSPYFPPPPAPFDEKAAYKEADYYVALFNYILPVGGICMIPIVGYVLLRLGLVSAFIIIGILNLVFSVVNTVNWVSNKWQIIAFIAYSCSRPLIFGAMATYIGRLFGFANFGKLYGVTRVTGSLFTCLQYPLVALVHHRLHENYYWVNVGFVVMGLVVLLTFPFYMWKCVFYGYFFRPEEMDTDEDLHEPLTIAEAEAGEDVGGNKGDGASSSSAPPPPPDTSSGTSTAIAAASESTALETVSGTLEAASTETATAVAGASEGVSTGVAGAGGVVAAAAAAAVTTAATATATAAASSTTTTTTSRETTTTTKVHRRTAKVMAFFKERTHRILHPDEHKG